MGSSVSTQDMKTITNTLTSITNDVVSMNKSSVGNSTTTAQYFDLTIGKDAKVYCVVTQSQTSTADVNYVTTVTQDMTTKLLSDLTTEVQNDDSQTMSTVREMLSGIGENIEDSNYLTVKTDIQNVINNTVTQSNLQSIANNALFIQEQTIDIEGQLGSQWTQPPAVCDFDQNIGVDIFTSSVVNQIVDTSLENAAATLASTTVDQDLKSEEKGINSAIDSIVGLLGSWETLAVLVGLGALIFVIVLATKGVKTWKELSKQRWFQILMVVLLILFLVWLVSATSSAKEDGDPKTHYVIIGTILAIALPLLVYGIYYLLTRKPTPPSLAKLGAAQRTAEGPGIEMTEFTAAPATKSDA